MRIAWLITAGLVLLWLFSFYQLGFNFWPVVIEALASGDAPYWYRLLFRPFIYIYLFGPFVIVSMLAYIFIARIRRRAGESNET